MLSLFRTIAGDRCRWIACRLVRGCVPPRLRRWGRDYSAQVAHAQLAEQHWPALLNLTWYGGFDRLGYSVLSPPVMALLGVGLPCQHDIVEMVDTPTCRSAASGSRSDMPRSESRYSLRTQLPKPTGLRQAGGATRSLDV